MNKKMNEKCIDEQQLQALAFGEESFAKQSRLKEHLEQCKRCKTVFSEYQELASQIRNEQQLEYNLNIGELDSMINEAINLSQKSPAHAGKVYWFRAIMTAAASFFLFLYFYQQVTLNNKLDQLEKQLGNLPSVEADAKIDESSFGFTIIRKHLKRSDAHRFESLLQLYQAKEKELDQLKLYLEEHYPGWQEEVDVESLEL